MYSVVFLLILVVFPNLLSELLEEYGRKNYQLLRKPAKLGCLSSQQSTCYFHGTKLKGSVGKVIVEDVV